MDGASCCVGATPPAALLSRSFADAAAIARALRFSLSDDAQAHPEPLPAAVTPAMHAAGTHPLPPGSSSSPPPSARCGSRLGPAGGRAGKRRPRPSKRVPTTYISTDAATFRLMVQRVTGADDDGDGPRDGVDHLGLGLLLPHLGVVGPLLPPPDAVAHHDAAAAYAQLPQPPAAEQPLFPTLDSWNVMYGKNEVA